MKLNLLFLLSLFIGFFGLSQKNNGYYGHKGFLQVETVMNYPMFSNIFALAQGNEAYSAGTSILIRKKDNFNLGFRVIAGYAIKRNVAISFEYGQDYSSVYPGQYPNIIDNWGNVYEVDHEMLDIKTNVFIPKIEFGTSKALLPMGLSHQIGFGVAYSKVQEKDYLYRYSYYDNNLYSYTSLPYTNYSTSLTDSDPINFKMLNPIKRYVLQYALSMRSPISKSLMIHYGLKYTLNIGRKYEYNYSNNYPEENEQYTYAINQAIANHRLYSIINLNIGLTYAF